MALELLPLTVPEVRRLLFALVRQPPSQIQPYSSHQMCQPAGHPPSAPKWADSLNHTQIRGVNTSSQKLIGGEVSQWLSL
jgi:hypothetical protein